MGNTIYSENIYNNSTIQNSVSGTTNTSGNNNLDNNQRHDIFFGSNTQLAFFSSPINLERQVHKIKNSW